MLNASDTRVNVSDHYPYGLRMPGRNFTTDNEGNRFQFTGHEFDGETNYEYHGARYYNRELGRYMSVDPLAFKYLSFSPYNYVAGNPIKFVDPDGKMLVIPTNLKGSQRRQIMRTLRRLSDDKLTYDKKTGIVSIKQSGSGNHPMGTDLVRQVIHDDHRLTTIRFHPKSGNSGIILPTRTREVDPVAATNGVGSNAIISISPDSDGKMKTTDPETTNQVRMRIPKFVHLGHEMIHALRAMQGIALPSDINDPSTLTRQVSRDLHGGTEIKNVPKDERVVVGLDDNKPGSITENGIRSEHWLTRNKLRGAY